MRTQDGGAHNWAGGAIRCSGLLSLMLIATGVLLPRVAHASDDPRISTRVDIATDRAIINFADRARRAPARRSATIPRRSIIPPPMSPFVDTQEAPNASSAESLTLGGGAAPLTLPTLSPAPASSFAAVVGGYTFPPDTNGAIGPDHLLVTLNSEVRIQDRAGIPLSAMDLFDFWSDIYTGYDVFDPKVLYDPYYGRFMVTSCVDRLQPSSGILVGVSQTSDPMGNWNLYRYDGDTANTTWADYPSMGFNKDWIVVQVNMFSIASGLPQVSRIFILNKADLYAGGSGQVTVASFGGLGGLASAPARTFDESLPELYLVQSSGSALTVLTVSGTVGAEHVSVGAPIASTLGPWKAFAYNFAPQLGSSQTIDAFDARMLSVVYRNGTLWAAHTVFIPSDAPTRSAVQWWQITPQGDVLQQGRIDDPAANIFYAYPSIAVNLRNDVLIGYSQFSVTTYGSAGYAFRASTDPPSTMRTGMVLKPGEASYVMQYQGRNRWGDFSSTVVDIDDNEMWTLQEYAASPANRWGTWWGRIVPPCGNGTIDPGEICDDGNVVNGDGCDVNCTPTGCGNGVASTGEECDDGNTNNDDACKNDCTLNVCGDGIVRTGVELCDDGNLVDGDGCDSNCRPTGCPNGVVTAGEQCDDGNSIDTDSCTSACVNATCGDGIVHAGVEECDDANAVEGDGCSGSCTLDRLLCYQTTVLDDASLPAANISLVDAFESLTADLARPLGLCNPAAVAGLDPSAATRPHALQSYSLRPRQLAQLLQGLPIRDQTYHDQFGTVTVDVARPTRLLVPAGASMSSTPPAPGAPGLDQFTCYSVRHSPGHPRFIPFTGLSVADRFGSTTLTVLKPLRLCVPNSGSGSQRLMCYRVRARSAHQGAVFVSNQFGTGRLRPTAPFSLCVPSVAQ